MKFKPAILGWFILFALAPCSVKEIIFSAANISYNKPLNKSRATPSFSCQYINENKKVLAEYNIKEGFILSKALSAIDNHSIFASPDKIPTYCSGNSPPKYILYKRLKLHIV